jgi:hypothetical protein
MNPLFKFTGFLSLLAISILLFSCTTSNTNDANTLRTSLYMKEAIIGHWQAVDHELSEYSIDDGLNHEQATLDQANTIFPQETYEDWYIDEQTLTIVHQMSGEQSVYSYEVSYYDEQDRTITLELSNDTNAKDKSRKTLELALPESKDWLYYSTEITLDDSNKTVNGTLMLTYKSNKTSP